MSSHTDSVAVQQAAKVVERAHQIEVRNIHVPVLVRGEWLLEAFPLAGGFGLPSREQPGVVQHPPHTGRTHGHHVGVQHHEGEPPITFQRITVVKLHDRPLLPLFQPEVARHPTVVLVHPPVARLPVVKLARPHAQPADELPGRHLGPVAPAAHEVYHLVARVVGYPLAPPISPILFFSATCSSISSAKTSSLVRSFFSRAAIRSCSCLREESRGRWKATAPFSNNCFSQW